MNITLNSHQYHCRHSFSFHINLQCQPVFTQVLHTPNLSAPSVAHSQTTAYSSICLENLAEDKSLDYSSVPTVRLRHHQNWTWASNRWGRVPAATDERLGSLSPRSITRHHSHLLSGSTLSVTDYTQQWWGEWALNAHTRLWQPTHKAYLVLHL